MQQNDLAVLLILGLATWRLSYMIALEHGPFGVFKTVRRVAPLGGLTSCIYCVSIWAAILFYVLWIIQLQWIVLLFAISGTAMILWRQTGASHVT